MSGFALDFTGFALGVPELNIRFISVFFILTWFYVVLSEIGLGLIGFAQGLVRQRGSWTTGKTELAIVVTTTYHHPTVTYTTRPGLV